MKKRAIRDTVYELAKERCKKALQDRAGQAIYFPPVITIVLDGKSYWGYTGSAMRAIGAVSPALNYYQMP